MSGLYVNTNVNSMIASTNLTKNMGNLSDVLTKLSTGLRINSAKDDPAGLIASEILRSEITASTSALKNTNRAIGMIGMADSALSQVGDLLNDIRGLVNEAANTGAMSDDQINANQLQIDASLDAIDRIAQSTTYMGKKLLDGSMAFQTANLDKGEISNLVINSANFGTQDSVHVQIDVQAASTAASQVYTKGALGSQGASVKITGNQGSQTFNFGAFTTTAAMAEQINSVSDSTGIVAIAGDAASAGIIDITSAGADNDIILEAKTAGVDAGNYSVKYTAGSSDGISYQITEGADGCPSTINFQLKMDEWKNASGVADESKLGIYDKETASGLILSSTTGSNVKQVNWVMDGASGITDPTVVFDKKTGIMTITYDGAAPPAVTDIEDAINAVTNLTGVKADATGLTVPTANEVESTSDLRANNGLTLTAKTGDTSMNGTNIVVVGNVNPNVNGVESSAIIAPGAGGLSIEALDIGTEWNGFTIKFAQGDADDGTVAAVFDAASKTITVTLNNGGGGNDIAYSDIADEIKDVDIRALTGETSPDAFSNYFTVTGGTDEVADGDPMPDSAVTSGGLDVAPAVDFDYVKTAQAASAVYKDNNGNYVQFKATDAGSKYNDYSFNFVNDDTVTNLGVALDEKNKVITITANFGDNGTDLSQVTYAQLADAINGLKNSEGKQLFQMTVYKEDPTNNTAALKANDLTGTFNLTDTTGGSTKTGTMFGQIGTDAGALIITLNDAAATPTSTAQDVIDAFNNTTLGTTPTDADIARMAKMKELQAMFSLTGIDGAGTTGAMFLTTDITVDADGNGTRTLSYNNALQGGSNGNVSNTTAKELVDFINNDAKLSEMSAPTWRRTRRPGPEN